MIDKNGKKKVLHFFLVFFQQKDAKFLKRLLCLIALSPALAFYTISI